MGVYRYHPDCRPDIPCPECKAKHMWGESIGPRPDRYMKSKRKGDEEPT